jgi:hypothetical protein
MVFPAFMASFVSSAARADITIDSFTSGDQAVMNMTQSSSVSGVVAASLAIGGDRVITINNGASVFSSVASVTSALDRFDFASQTGPPANASTFQLMYDGSTSTTLNPTGLGGVNTSLMTGVTLSGSNTSNGPELVTLTFITDATHASQATISIPSGASNQPFFAPFTSFAGGVPGFASPANFNSLGAFTATVSYANQQGSSGEFTNLAFAAVPEPSSIAMMSLIGVAAGIARLWKKKKATAASPRAISE